MKYANAIAFLIPLILLSLSYSFCGSRETLQFLPPPDTRKIIHWQNAPALQRLYLHIVNDASCFQCECQQHLNIQWTVFHVLAKLSYVWVGGCLRVSFKYFISLLVIPLIDDFANSLRKVVLPSSGGVLLLRHLKVKSVSDSRQQPPKSLLLMNSPNPFVCFWLIWICPSLSSKCLRTPRWNVGVRVGITEAD